MDACGGGARRHAARLELAAWFELLANRTRKAKAASAAAGEVPVLAAALAWASKRTDARRKDALVQAAQYATPARRTLAARLLHQADECPPELALFLRSIGCATRAARIWCSAGFPLTDRVSSVARSQSCAAPIR